MPTQEAPSEDATEHPVSGRGRYWKWVLRAEGLIERLFIMFCVYTLSIGPMYWEYINARHAHGRPIVAAFYEPLRILGELVPPFGEWLNWYISFWVQ